MTVVNLWANALSASSAAVVATTADVSTARLAVADNPDMSGPRMVDATSLDPQGVARFHIGGLEPDSRYWYRVEADSVLDGPVGTFLTHPPLGEPADFTFWAASCAGGNSVDTAAFPVPGALAPHRFSDHPVFSVLAQRALAERWLFGNHLGDRGYPDLGSGQHGIVGGASLDNLRAMLDDNLRASRQQQAHLAMSISYEPDDHELQDNHDRFDPGLPGLRQVLREKTPHFDYPDPGGYYWHTTIGRALIFASDVRSYRDPNNSTAPDKTMLGANQRQLMESLLQSTGAEFFVWLSPDRWRWAGQAGANDSWASFEAERDAMVEMFGDLGWLHRMAIVCGDNHSLGLDSGTLPGRHCPVLQVAPLDANPTGPLPQTFDTVAVGNQRGVYGTIRVRDTGSQIACTLSAYTSTELRGQFTRTVAVTPPPPPPAPPSPTPVARARIRRRVTWYGCHAVTGRIIAELPDVRGEVGRLLSAYDSAQLTIPIPLGGPGHVPIRLIEQATQLVNSAVVAVVNDLPVWMGIVLRRQGGTGAEMRLACATPEAMLTRMWVRDHTMMGVDRAQAAAILIQDANGIAGLGGGYRFEIDAELTGDIIDREYRESDRQTIYDALRELATDGLEFTVDLDWQSSDHNVIRKIVRLGSRIGKSADGALFETTASSMFESRAGSEATYELIEDATTGRMANYVVAIGPGEGDDQPASEPAIDHEAIASGAPLIQHLLDLSSSAAQSQEALNAAARAELARLRRGAEVWEISARLDSYPRLGVDAQLGDTVSWLLTGHRHPTGVMGTGRMVGYRVDQQAGRWRPILLDPQEVP